MFKYKGLKEYLEKKEQVRGGLRKSQNDEFRNLHSSTNIIWITK
jgi:hypothetical protein